MRRWTSSANSSETSDFLKGFLIFRAVGFLCSEQKDAYLTRASSMQLEHEAAAWLDREHLHSVKWLHADDVILDEIGRLL